MITELLLYFIFRPWD